MIGFVLCNLALALLVHSRDDFLRSLASPAALGIGLALVVASLTVGFYKKAATLYWHDGFCSGCLLAWYAYWQPQFNEDAPMFFFFPLYYALLTSIVTLSLINKSENFDSETVAHLRYLDKLSRIDMNTSIVFVLLSLLITRHYALYPIAMTLFIARHTMTVCLENIDNA